MVASSRKIQIGACVLDVDQLRKTCSWVFNSLTAGMEPAMIEYVVVKGLPPELQFHLVDLAARDSMRLNGDDLVYAARLFVLAMKLGALDPVNAAVRHYIYRQKAKVPPKFSHS